jgi:hypothetical protein
MEGQSDAGFGVYGHSVDGRGVVAESVTNYGLRATSVKLAGIRSSSTEGSSVEGEGAVSCVRGGTSSNTGTGVLGRPTQERARPAGAPPEMGCTATVSMAVVY